VFLSAFGVAGDPSAGGAIVEPLPPQDRDVRAVGAGHAAREQSGAHA
jgi:hypothetical protein